jgi:hypothetical protein
MAVKTKNTQNLQRQLDEAFPLRHKPDGWLGDLAHRGRTSGHNADDTAGSKPAWDGDPDRIPEVRALDVSAELDPGVDSMAVINHLRKLPRFDTVCRYLIHRGKIFHARTGFTPQDYDGGSNPHDHHFHYEGAWSQAADNNDTFDFRLGEVPMALTEGDKKWISAEIAKQSKVAVADLLRTDEPTRRLMRAFPWQYVGGGIPEGKSTLGVLDDIHEQTVREVDDNPQT